MLKQNRDLTIDYVRGLACIFMMCVHTSVNDFAGLDHFIFFCSYMPAIFISISGYLATEQAKRDELSKIIILYLSIFLLGFAYNGFMPQYYFPKEIPAGVDPATIRPDGMTFFIRMESEILQGIAAGCILVAVCSKLFKDRHYLYLFTCIGIFGLFKVMSPLVPDFMYRSFFIAPGVFPAIPWVAFAFIGVFAYAVPNRNNLILLLVSLMVCVLVYFALQYGFDWKTMKEAHTNSKFSMSTWYILGSFVVVFSFYFLVRLAGSRLPAGKYNPILFFGQNSMLFFFVHFMFSYYIIALQVKFFLASWSLILILTYFFMRLLILINGKIKARMYNPVLWILLAVLIFATPVVFRSNIFIIVHLEFLYGLVVALRYPELSHRIKKYGRESPPVGSGAVSAT